MYDKGETLRDDVRSSLVAVVESKDEPCSEHTIKLENNSGTEYTTVYDYNKKDFNCSPDDRVIICAYFSDLNVRIPPNKNKVKKAVENISEEKKYALPESRLSQVKF